MISIHIEDKVYEKITFAGRHLAKANYEDCKFSIPGVLGLLSKFDIEVD